jgi:uncharacterized radical SAM superfamily protein
MITHKNNDQNIIFDINENNENDEKNENNDATELELLLKEIENSDINDFLLNNNYDFESKILAKRFVYEMEYNVKQLLKICDYYGISKDIKVSKLKKNEIIDFLIDFEENNANIEIVYKRQQLWYFMNELKNDKFMKKYVIW